MAADSPEPAVSDSLTLRPHSMSSPLAESQKNSMSTSSITTASHSTTQQPRPSRRTTSQRYETFIIFKRYSRRMRRVEYIHGVFLTLLIGSWLFASQQLVHCLPQGIYKFWRQISMPDG
jgi:hypothetical protein